MKGVVTVIVLTIAALVAVEYVTATLLFLFFSLQSTE